MRIASIDPGIETGIALANILYPAVKTPTNEIRLGQYFLGTYKLPGSILDMIQYSHIDHVVVERRPALITGIGVELYNAVLEGIKQLGYIPSSAKLANLEQRHIILIGPGLWKPVTGRSSVEAWGPRNDHEKDAMRMLLYYAQIKFPDRSIRYA